MKNTILISFCCHGLALAFLLHWVGFRFNWTDSMPHGVYQIVPGKPDRGDLITFSLEEDSPYFDLAFERRYLGLNGDKPLLKVLAGTPGDKITVSAQGISVNSKLLPNTQAKACDQLGRQLPVLLKSIVIPSAKGLALSTYTENSFDSRYFGLVDMNQVRRVVPVLTFRLGG